jgi:hypothetical protein
MGDSRTQRNERINILGAIPIWEHNRNVRKEKGTVEAVPFIPSFSL